MCHSSVIKPRTTWSGSPAGQLRALSDRHSATLDVCTSFWFKGGLAGFIIGQQQSRDKHAKQPWLMLQSAYITPSFVTSY